MIDSKPTPVYRIRTAHLTLRCWQPADAEQLKAAIDANLEHLQAWLPWAMAEPQPLQQKIDLIRKWRSDFDSDRNYVYGIFNRDETMVIGGTGMHVLADEKVVEIGYWIGRDYTRQGYATEASAAQTKVAFTLFAMERVEIVCNIANTYSAAVPRKLGFTLDATLRKRLRENDARLHDMMVWSMFAEEYGQSPAAAFESEAYDAIDRRVL